MILTPARRRLRKRIKTLPTATHDCQRSGIWIRRNGKLGCVICGRP